MTWEELSLDLRVLILSMRHKMRQEAQGTIVRYWKKFYAPKKVAHYLVERERWSMGGVWNEEGVFGGDRMNVMYPETAEIMEYCVKVLSGREKPNYWKEILEEVEFELWSNHYLYFGDLEEEYMSRVDDAFIKLGMKFNYDSKWEDFQREKFLVLDRRITLN